MVNKYAERFRREGYKAFDPFADKNLECPYDKASWNNWNKYWLEGWAEAEEEYEAEQKEFDADTELHADIMAEIEDYERNSATISNLVMLLIKRRILK